MARKNSLARNTKPKTSAKTGTKTRKRSSSRKRKQTLKSFIEHLTRKTEHPFYAVNGMVWYSIADFLKDFHLIDDSTYHYHCSQRNDFATWIQDVFRDELLANSLRRAANKYEALIAINKYLIDNILG